MATLEAYLNQLYSFAFHEIYTLQEVRVNLYHMIHRQQNCFFFEKGSTPASASQDAHIHFIERESSSSHRVPDSNTNKKKHNHN